VTRTLYVSDLDGTLLGPDARVSAFTRRTVNGLVADGELFALATARSRHSVRKVTGGLRVTAPAVVYGGAFVVDLATGRNLVERTLRPATVDDVLASFDALGLAPLVYSATPGGPTLDVSPGLDDTVSWVGGHDSDGIRWYLADRGADPRFRPVGQAGDLPRLGAFSIVALGRRDDLEPAARILRSRLDGDVSVSLQEETYLPGLFWLDISAAGSTKGVGVQTLADLTGADRIVCFGDNLNDLDMFEAADECYAVANAHPEVLAAATGIIGSNSDDGVARWLAANVRLERTA
jgi:hydroxymethylpyrimidine pyrophosphatase-like HAD family hydrolase